MNPKAPRLDHHTHTVAGLESRDSLNWCPEVRHIKAPTQALWQCGLEELHDHGLPLHANIDTHLVVRECYNNAPGTIRTASKIEVFERLGVAAAVFREHRCWRHRGRRASDCVQHHQERLALYLRLIGGWLFEIEYHACAVPRLYHADRLQIALVDLDGGTTHSIGNTRKIQRNTSRRLNREATRHSRQRLRQIDTYYLRATLYRPRHGLNRGLRMGRQRYQRQHQSRDNTFPK